jgi:hypothetical protein
MDPMSIQGSKSVEPPKGIRGCNAGSGDVVLFPNVKVEINDMTAGKGI